MIKCLTKSFVQMRWTMKAKEEKEQAPGILVTRVKPTLDHIITQICSATAYIIVLKEMISLGSQSQVGHYS